MADLITTIKVNSNQFDNSIKESTNQIRKFKSEGDKASGSVGGFEGKLRGLAMGGLTKIAGALGVAFTAMEAFDKMIQSTQGTADAFEITIQQARSGVDYFFTSLSTGNWDNFFDGILKATKYAKEFTEYMDALGDIKVSTQFFSGSEQRLMSEQRAILSDPDATKKEKEAALNIMESINKRVEERARAQSDASKGAITTRISEELNKINSRAYDAFKNFNEEDLQEIYDVYKEVSKLNISSGQKFYKFEEGLAKKGLVLEDGLGMSIFKAVASQITGAKSPGFNVSKSKERLENEFKNQLVKDVVNNLEDWELPLYGIEDRNDYDSNLVLTSTFFERALSGTDKEFMVFEEKITELNKEIDGLKKLKKNSQKTTDMEGNPSHNSSFKPEDLERLRQLEKDRTDLIMADPVNNALVELKNVMVNSTKELAQLNQDSENELTNVANTKRIINRERKRLNSEYGNKNKPILPEGSIAYLEERIANLNKQIKLETDPVTYKALNEEIERLKKEIVYIQVMYTTNFDPNEKIENSIKPLNVENKYFKDGKVDVSGISITAPDLTESMSWIDTYTNALDIVRDKNSGMLESFNSISNALSAIGNASDSNAGAMFRWLASVTSSIGQAIPVIQALIMTKKAEATANAEAAATGAAASVAGTPVVGALLAVGAVAAVLASFASIPKFAEGGLVYGNTIAQVGEYAGASNNPEVIAPLSKLRKILADTNGGGSGSVDFRISGKDLVGVINNYSSKNNKK